MLGRPWVHDCSRSDSPGVVASLTVRARSRLCTGGGRATRNSTIDHEERQALSPAGQQEHVRLVKSTRVRSSNERRLCKAAGGRVQTLPGLCGTDRPTVRSGSDDGNAACLVNRSGIIPPFSQCCPCSSSDCRLVEWVCGLYSLDGVKAYGARGRLAMNDESISYRLGQFEGGFTHRGLCGAEGGRL